MTFSEFARHVAYSESCALRAYARAGRLPACRPVDLWHEWQARQPGRKNP